ncbi:hypothetical protein [Engelhardtia mirabilis]|uniref:Uncharacterized protein n=1 Tax=Engelhardtia mirabilis TaxID=2528011 RepID=A0A518BL62_9BACT|nr:hypothetical protein Pla133_27810 [Planctomycetes bacterium Pla133]QDV02019.1 hypothetical protein Pla86_27800 [Planctomycetes bacterium Pla86]
MSPWKLVSDEEPPKDGRWYRFCERRGTWRDLHWYEDGWCDQSGDFAYDLLPDDLWTLAPGQEAGEDTDQIKEAVRLARKEVGQVIDAFDPTPTDDGHWKLSDREFGRLGYAAWRLDRLLDGNVGRAVEGHPSRPKPLEVDGEVES